MIVYDPIAPRSGDGVCGWAGYVCNTWERFEATFWQSSGCLAVIDEAAEASLEHRFELRRMLTRGRHIDPATGGGGHCCLLIAQRHLLLDKSAREQCSTLYAFNVGAKDAADLAESWNCPALLKLPDIPPYHYIYLQRHQRPRMGVLKP